MRKLTLLSILITIAISSILFDVQDHRFKDETVLVCPRIQQQHIKEPKVINTYAFHETTTLTNRGDDNRARVIVTSTPSEAKIEIKPYTDEDLYWLAKIVHAEAPDEIDEGQIAVANVVLNRVKSKWGKSIKAVIFQRINGTAQFSPVEDGGIKREPDAKSRMNAKKALEGTVIVPESVVYFYMPTKYNMKDWIRTRKLYQEIGCHRFCF